MSINLFNFGPNSDPAVAGQVLGFEISVNGDFPADSALERTEFIFNVTAAFHNSWAPPQEPRGSRAFATAFPLAVGEDTAFTEVAALLEPVHISFRRHRGVLRLVGLIIDYCIRIMAGGVPSHGIVLLLNVSVDMEVVELPEEAEEEQVVSDFGDYGRNIIGFVAASDAAIEGLERVRIGVGEVEDEKPNCVVCLEDISPVRRQLGCHVRISFMEIVLSSGSTPVGSVHCAVLNCQVVS